MEDIENTNFRCTITSEFVGQATEKGKLRLTVLWNLWSKSQVEGDEITTGMVSYLDT